MSDCREYPHRRTKMIVPEGLSVETKTYGTWWFIMIGVLLIGAVPVVLWLWRMLLR